MQKCLICENSLDGIICQHCGYDASLDYEKYPTISIILNETKSNSAIRNDHLQRLTNRTPPGNGQAKRKRKHFAQDTALKWFESVGDFPQILKIPYKYEYIVPKVFAKLALNGKEIRQIIIPDSVEEIADNAFAGLIVTEAVYIPKSVQKIGLNAFTLGDDAYVYCENGVKKAALSGIRKLGGRIIRDKSYKSKNENKINVIISELSRSIGVTRIKSQTFPFSTPKEEVEEIIVPEGVCIIEQHALDNVRIKKRISIPSSVTRIGESAFDLMPGAFVDCEENSYAYFFCRQNGISNSVDRRKLLTKQPLEYSKSSVLSTPSERNKSATNEGGELSARPNNDASMNPVNMDQLKVGDKTEKIPDWFLLMLLFVGFIVICCILFTLTSDISDEYGIPSELRVILLALIVAIMVYIRSKLPE